MSVKLIDAARKLFKRFHEREPDNDEIVEIDANPGEPALRVGDLVGVIYEVDSGQQYQHEFDKNDRPGLYVSSDGQQIYVVAGRYVFTERGFIK